MAVDMNFLLRAHTFRNALPRELNGVKFSTQFNQIILREIGVFQDNAIEDVVLPGHLWDEFLHRSQDSKLTQEELEEWYITAWIVRLRDWSPTEDIRSNSGFLKVMDKLSFTMPI